jgi:hypothetical protein
MIAPAKPRRSRKRPGTAWHVGFLRMLPKIVRHAKVILPRLRPEARADAIQEIAANAAVAYARLAELGKEDVAYPTPLATFAVRQFVAGRRVGGRLNCRDVSSEYAQQRKRFMVERLDRRDEETGEWIEAVVEDTRTPPADQAAFRVDFPDWLASLSRRNERIAEALALGHTTGAVARRFGVSPGRISQLRQELRTSWTKFHGELPQADPTVPA